MTDSGVIMVGLGFFTAAVVVALMIGAFPDWWPVFKDWLISTIKNIFDPNFGLGPSNHRQRHYGTNTNIFSPYRPHIHRWQLSKSTKHNWWAVNGLPSGENNDIDKVIKCLEEKPGHSETNVQMVRSWKTSGAEIVYTSWNHWRCSLCSQIKNTEFYTAPSKKDGTPIFKIDLNKYEAGQNTWNKTTIRIPIIPSKREVPVETMKKYK